MPFTPYHWGPTSWAGLLLFRVLDLPTLLVASVVVDVEPTAVLLFGLHYPMHGFCHTLLGGSALAVLTAIAMYSLRHPTAIVMTVFRLQQRSSFPKMLLTSFLGVYGHVLLDSPLYTDITPFYPSHHNPLYGLFSAREVYLFCILSFAIGGCLYLLRIWAADRSGAHRPSGG